MGDFVDSVRAFNRFYTRQIGLLGKAYLHSKFSLTEVRVLYELAHRRQPLASDLVRDLDLDAGYLSRILDRFERAGVVSRKRSKEDARQVRLGLTAKGKKMFAPLETRSRAQVRAMVSKLSAEERGAMASSMRTIERLLGAPSSKYVLRSHRAGDMGWVIERHGALYWREYGYDLTFEALVAEIAAKFVRDFDSERERCWIAERDGERVGSVFLVRGSDGVAKLRLLLVDPSARGLGLGKRLVAECVSFARAVGYKKVVLWTQSELLAARGIYESAGFRRVAEEGHVSFGKDLVAETWELEL